MRWGCWLSASCCMVRSASLRRPGRPPRRRNPPNAQRRLGLPRQRHQDLHRRVLLRRPDPRLRCLPRFRGCRRRHPALLRHQHRQDRLQHRRRLRRHPRGRVHRRPVVQRHPAVLHRRHLRLRDHDRLPRARHRFLQHPRVPGSLRAQGPARPLAPHPRCVLWSSPPDTPGCGRWPTVRRCTKAS